MNSRSFSSLALSSKLPTYSAAFRPEGFDLVTRVHRSSSSSESKGFSWRADGRDVFASGGAGCVRVWPCVLLLSTSASRVLVPDPLSRVASPVQPEEWLYASASS